MNSPPFVQSLSLEGPWPSLEKYLVGFQLLWFPGALGRVQSQPGLVPPDKGWDCEARERGAGPGARLTPKLPRSQNRVCVWAPPPGLS